MTSRSTSWFDRDELKALFKGVRPPKAPGLEGELTAPQAAPAAPPSPPGPEAPPSPLLAEAMPSPAPPMPPSLTAEAPAPFSTGEGDTLSPKEAAPPAPAPRSEALDRAALREEGATEAAPPMPAPVLADLPPPAAVPPLPPLPTSEKAPVPDPPKVALAAAGPSPARPDSTGEAIWRLSDALLRLARGQVAAQALEERLWEITETAASVLSLARASVWRFEDEEQTRLTCADLYSKAPDAHESGQGQSARDHPAYFAALHSGRSIVASDAKADPRTRELVTDGLAATQSRLEAPVLTDGRLAGVLRLEHEGAPRHFDLHEERFAASLADLAGLALETQERRLKEAVAKVGEERVRAQRDALAELSRSEALTRGQMEGVLQEVTEAGARVLRLERASVWVYAPDYRSVFCLDAFERAAARHHRGFEIHEEQAPVYLESLRSGGRLVTADAREDSRLAELLRDGIVPPGIASRLEAPIHLVGRLAGVLWCERAGSPRTWLADEERFVEALAGFVALSIATSERRRTENELQRVLEALDRTESPAPSEAVAEAETPQAPDAFDE